MAKEAAAQMRAASLSDDSTSRLLGYPYRNPPASVTMSTELVEEKEEETQATLPLCEANRELVTRPDVYVSNVVFTVGALRFIDKAP